MNATHVATRRYKTRVRPPTMLVCRQRFVAPLMTFSRLSTGRQAELPADQSVSLAVLFTTSSTGTAATTDLQEHKLCRIIQRRVSEAIA